MIKLKNWSVTRRTDDPYLAPEFWPYVLQGETVDHPGGFPDGCNIVTSRVVSFDRETLVAITSSGSQYVLAGTPDRNWSAFLFANSYTVDSFFDRLG